MSDIKIALHEFVMDRRAKAIIPAKVIALDESKFTCDVTDVDDNDYLDVKLRAATTGANDGQMFIPKVGSWVMIGNVGNSPNRFCVLMFSELQSALWNMRTAKMQLDGDGFYLWTLAAGTSMAVLMADFIDAVKNMTVVTPAGNGVLDPVGIANLEALKLKFNNLLKDSI